MTTDTVERSSSECKQLPGLFEPVINMKRCEGKGDCERVCPESVFEVRRMQMTCLGSWDRRRFVFSNQRL
ncbi:MAG: hypothetical protein EB110_07060 [Betaproteobacteria bacterium]|nr:hypothetical protein [Betaproteobacteria bacterium]